MPRPRRLRRCQLSVPGSSEKMMAKSAGLDCDHVFLDLEDAVAPNVKSDARGMIVEALNKHDWKPKTLSVRINDVETEYCHEDIIEVVTGAGHKLDTIMLTKAKSASDVMFVHMMLDQLEAKLGLKNSDWSEQVEVVSVDLVEDGPINWPEAGAEAAREVEDDKDEPEADVAGWYSKDLGAQAYRQGIHTKTYPNGATYRGYYLNDKRHGAGIKTHADGMHVHCVYEHGVKVGGYL